MKLVFSPEVAAARRTLKPLVALETSVIAQGLPYPANLEAMRRCEKVIRECGAVPAATAVINGRLHIGLEPQHLEALANGQDVHKLGSRDLAMAVARQLTGGTTVSATCEMAAAAGILVFATGGLGGVHRGAEFDVSQDLPSIARWPIAVVCAGAKSVLDLPKTMEYLETLGVPVLGFGSHELPGFFTRETGIQLEHSVNLPAEAADIIRARRDLGQGGIVLTVPPPLKSAMKRSEIEKHLKASLIEAKKKKIEGKAVTPFLLHELAKRTKGRTQNANLDLLENNARVAAQVSVSLGWR